VSFGQCTLRIGQFELTGETFEFTLIEVCMLAERDLLGTRQLTRDQVRKVWEVKPLVEAQDIDLDVPCTHEVDARQQHTEHIQERFDPV
jgi:hypothetical protein